MHNIRLSLMTISIVAICTIGCEKMLPKDLDSVDPGAQFRNVVYSPILGRTTVYLNNFSYGQSSLPLNFEIINLRRYDGTPAPELNEKVYPVMAWKSNTGGYTGEEKSLEEIEKKRTVENHKVFEIRKNSGDVVVWSGINTSEILSRPDSGYKFDVKVSNEKSVRYFYNLRFIPYKPVPYEPNNYDINTGMTTGPSVSSDRSRIIVTSMFKSKDGSTMSGADVDVIFRKTGNGNSLKFRFLDSVYNPINPNLFNKTNWQTLVHGFDAKVTNTDVTYTVAYPIPLVNGLPTKYTNTSGTRASVRFSYYRLGVGGFGFNATLGLEFAIFEKGDWEIDFYFKNSSPKFSND